MCYSCSVPSFLAIGFTSGVERVLGSWYCLDQVGKLMRIQRDKMQSMKRYRSERLRMSRARPVPRLPTHAGSCPAFAFAAPAATQQYTEGQFKAVPSHTLADV